MRISFKGDYALKTILDLSLNYDKGPMQIEDISKRQDIPLKYLQQILLTLKGAGYVRSRRGPSGGYSLSKSPSKITLGEIIRLMEGHTSPITCVSTTEYTKCNYENKCVFRGIWVEIKENINNIIDNTNFEDMVKKAVKLKEKNSLMYNI
jgi:Rrf2 family protein